MGVLFFIQLIVGIVVVISLIITNLVISTIKIEISSFLLSYFGFIIGVMIKIFAFG
jgi:uncharacterized membrane protein